MNTDVSLVSGTIIDIELIYWGDYPNNISHYSYDNKQIIKRAIDRYLQEIEENMDYTYMDDEMAEQIKTLLNNSRAIYKP